MGWKYFASLVGLVALIQVGACQFDPLTYSGQPLSVYQQQQREIASLQLAGIQVTLRNEVYDTQRNSQEQGVSAAGGGGFGGGSGGGGSGFAGTEPTTPAGTTTNGWNGARAPQAPPQSNARRPPAGGDMFQPIPTNGVNKNSPPGAPIAPPQPQPAPARRPAQPSNNNDFNAKLFQEIAPRHAQQNLLYSPISLETIMALIYTGASGETAQELQTALNLPAQRDLVYQHYGALPKSVHTADLQLQMANKLYFNQELSLEPEFSSKARQYFDAAAEPVNFQSRQRTANDINNWVAAKTNQRIRNLIDPMSLDGQTSAVLVNALYFKGRWAKEFSSDDTQRGEFGVQRQPVEMMYNEDQFHYVKLPSMGASAVELPFAHSDLSMLILLPDNVDGLAQLESHIGELDLRTLPQHMSDQLVRLQLPKFRIEFEMSVGEALQQLNVNRLFSNRAELSGIFRGQQAGISKVQHKAFMDVSEAGVEAAASTFSKLVPLSLPSNIIHFKVDHPFMFAIRSPLAVYFIGHVVNP